MKFEHVLQIYWTKHFFFGGKVFTFDQTLTELKIDTPGLGKTFRRLLLTRFELTMLEKKRSTSLLEYQELSHRVINLPLNIIFSQVNSVNNIYIDLYRFNLIRLYLIKTYRGRCHALGKPVRGQRTWSNAWNSYKCNKTLRGFISETKRYIKENTREQRKDFKKITRKYAVVQKINPLTKDSTRRLNRSGWF